MPPLELFMTALPAQGVTLDKTPDGKASLRGLPVLRVGTWNGRAYTAADLQSIADNFAEVQASDSWEPPLRPRHLLDSAGNAVSLDARETLAWHKGLRYDPAAQLLTADLEVVDADTVAALESGKLRYVSAEIVRSGYTSPVTGKQYETPVYYGAAFVDNPAVKGMPWRLVTNAEELGHSRPESKESDSKMSWLETFKSLLRREGVADEELAAVDQLAAGPPAPPQAPAAPPPDDGVRAQMEQLAATVRDQAALIETLTQTRAQEAAQATVDRLVSEGTVPPAMRVQCLALVQALSTGGEVEILSADAEGKPATRKLALLDVLQELLAGMAPRLRAPSALQWTGPETLATDTPALTDADLDRIAALAGGTPKGGSN
jgi:hypothetical protein